MLQSPAALGPLRVLLVEDSPEDAELTSIQLLDAGLEAQFQCVESGPALRRAMAEFQPDLVLSDLSMPGFSGDEALRIVREMAPRMPFIFVSGTMGEETAVQALREGADDYILKHNPARLPAAALRAVREARSDAERERVEQELLRAQRLDGLAMLAAGLSHDLRNILQPLLLVPELLAGHSDDPRVRRLGDVVAECGRRGCDMAQSMLSFVRGSRAANQRVSIEALFQALQLLLRSSLPPGVRMQVEVADATLAVDANYTELQQALLNLCLNAIQAMPAGGTLSLSAEPASDGGVESVRIRVTDTGTGMDDGVRGQLFTPFFSTKRDGTGLGLMSCKRVVDGHGGSIVVSSELGVGTTFEILLPLRRSEPAEAAPEMRIDGRGQRVLVVDGDGTRLSLIGNALESQGLAPVLAADGAMALRAVDEAMPELVVIDSDILLLSAVSLLLALREQGYAGPVIALQDSNRPLARADLPPGMALQVLAKPLEMRQVFNAVASALASGGRGS